MSKTLKWILGVLAVLVVIAIAAGAFFVWQNHMSLAANYRVRVAQPPTNGTPAPNAPNNAPGQKGPMMPYGFRMEKRPSTDGFGWREPMMGERGLSHFGAFGPFGMGFFLLGGLLRLIVPLGVLVLVALISYQMGKNAGATAKSTSPPSNPGPTDIPQRGRKIAKS
jgi:hypothetical protein